MTENYLENLGETKKYLVCGEAESLGATQKFQLITDNNNLVFLGYANGMNCKNGKEFIFGTLYTENLERFQKETKSFYFRSDIHPRGAKDFYDSETHMNILGHIELNKLEFVSNFGFGIGHWK